MLTPHVAEALEKHTVRNKLISDTHRRSSFEIGSINWVHWYLSLPGNEFLLEVPRSFLEDDFNFSGLGMLIPLFKEALGILLGIIPECLNADLNLIEASIEHLYSLLHQRYIISRPGLLQMKKRYVRGEFGFCQRYYCYESPLLPCGTSDSYAVDSVKLYCTNCLDIYNPTNSRFLRLDGACFGTTFSHMLFLTLFPTDYLHCSSEVYTPKIHGFRIHETNLAGHRNSWLRKRIVDSCESESCESEEELVAPKSLLNMTLEEFAQPVNGEVKQLGVTQMTPVKTNPSRTNTKSIHRANFKRHTKSDQTENSNGNHSRGLCLLS
ncbi:casein kinase 2 regulatory subunit [Basidiobolus ranarum]|uniref:Casein kinase II subunit beta n=1 Tax=Basidiobolus ranarum TaxID=34480 RepID=A0ABR2VYL1_9FUNG